MTLPTALSDSLVTKRSGLLFHWRAADLSLDPITGQTATFANASTGSQDDTVGTTYTSGHTQPRWHWDTNLSAPTLRMTSAGVEQLKWEMNLIPREMTVYAAIVQTAAHSASGGALVHIGHESNIATSPYFLLDISAGGYVLTHHNGASNRAVTLTMSPLPAVGEGVEVIARLQADGGVELECSIEEDTPYTNTSGAALAPASAWAGPFLHINSVVTSNRRLADWRALKITPGIRTFAEMRRAF